MKYLLDIPDEVDISKSFAKFENGRFVFDAPIDAGTYVRYCVTPELYFEKNGIQNSSEVLVIRVPMNMKEKDYQSLLETFTYEKNVGVILLPPGYEAIVVPKDIRIELETPNKSNDT